MKNKGLYLGIFVSILLISFVSAAVDLTFVTDFLKETATALKPIFQYTIGDPGGSDDIFVVKVLLFILMIAVVYLAAERVPGINSNSFVLWLVTIIISMLGARFLSSKELVETVWLPSGVVGITLASFLPFLVFFFFIESFQGHKVVRRVGWILYCVLFVVIAAVRWPQTSVQSGALAGWNLSWIYITTAVLALLSFYFDGTIQKYFAKAGVEKAVAVHINEAIKDRKRKLLDAFSDYNKGMYGAPGTAAAKKAYNAEVARLEKEIADFAKRI
jgi:hypothetical protein